MIYHALSINRLLHASYWFLSLEMRFLDLGMPNLAHTMHTRDKVDKVEQFRVREIPAFRNQSSDN